ncbi:MAG: hypothetical protein KJP14_12325, partial [Eudoraea sp.]|nr:hypothetical protein [Eudoraea sp.]
MKKLRLIGQSVQTLFSLKIRYFLLLCFFLAGFQSQVFAQDYTTTGNSTNWNDAAAWDCSGGGCNNNPFPDNNVSNSTITINHDINYTSNPPINLGNRAILEVNGATFTNLSNLNINSSSAIFRTSNAIVSIGPGVMNVDGPVQIINSVVTKDGNVVNNQEINVNNACFTLDSGNFNNYGIFSGTGGVKVLSGNINNFGTWSTDILYYYSNNGSGLPGTLSTIEEVDETCACALSNVGNTAPVLNTEAPTSFCEGEPLPELNADYITSDIPNTTGIKLTWSSNPDPLVIEDHLTGPVPGPGTYYGFFYDADNNCASPTVAVMITVDPLPIVTVENEAGCVGEDVTFSANVTNSDPGTTYSYQWYLGEVLIPTETSNSLTVAGVTLDMDASSYKVVVTNDSNQCRSEQVSATLTVNPLPLVSVADQEVCAIGTGDPVSDGNATFAASINNGSPTDTYSYQWYFNDVEIGGATSITYTVTGATSAQNNGVYKVVITNETTGCISDASGTLTVNNCDIECVYNCDGKTNGKLSPALLELANTYPTLPADYELI